MFCSILNVLREFAASFSARVLTMRADCVPFDFARARCFVFHWFWHVCAVWCSIRLRTLWAVSCFERLRTCVLFRVPFDFGRVCCFVFRSTRDVRAVPCSVPLCACALSHVPKSCLESRWDQTIKQTSCFSMSYARGVSLEQAKYSKQLVGVSLGSLVFAKVTQEHEYRIQSSNFEFEVQMIPARPQPVVLNNLFRSTSNLKGTRNSTHVQS